MKFDLKQFIQECLVNNSGKLNPNAGRKDWWLRKGYSKEYDSILKATDFISSNGSMVERVYCILNDIEEVPYCKECKKMKVGWQRQQKQYGSFCSPKCKAKNKDVAEKIAKTNLERYGATNPFGSESIRGQIKKTNLERYGEEYPQKSYKIRQKISETKHNQDQNKQRRKREVTCLSKYGKENVFQKLSPHIIQLLDNRTWLYTQYKTKNKSTTKIAEELGVYYGTVIRYLNKHGIDIKYDYYVSTGESEVVDYIRSLYSGEIETSVRWLIYPFEIDILIPEYKIAIEYCGLYWHSSKVKSDRYYHVKKLKMCNEVGYRLVTIFENEWKHNRTIVEKKLSSILGKADHKVYARNCDVVGVSSQDFKTFLDDNHIQGNHHCSIRLGLKHKGELVGVLGLRDFSKGVYDLNRYATKYQVTGGFSKLLSYFKKNYNWKSIQTFADRRYSEGNLYYRNGFMFVGNTPPNYKYVKGDKVYPREQFMKHTLKTLLNNFDPLKTEEENMRDNGYHRIYDCGNMRFQLVNNGYVNKTEKC